MHFHPTYWQALERLAGLLEGPTGSVVLTERGDGTPLPRHPGFRLLAAMNPATDAGTTHMCADSCMRGCTFLRGDAFVHASHAHHCLPSSSIAHRQAQPATFTAEPFYRALD